MIAGPGEGLETRDPRPPVDGTLFGRQPSLFSWSVHLPWPGSLVHLAASRYPGAWAPGLHGYRMLILSRGYREPGVSKGLKCDTFARVCDVVGVL